MKFTPTKFVSALLILSYGVVPALAFSTRDGQVYIAQYVHSPDVLFYIITVFELFSLFYLGTFLAGKVKLRGIILFQDAPHLHNYRLEYLLLTIFSVVCFFYFVVSYGGLINVFNNISNIRTGSYAEKNYIASFFGILSNIGIVSLGISFLVLFYPLIKINKYFASIIFTLTLLFLMLKEFLEGGRGGILGLFVYLFLLVSFLTQRMPKLIWIASLTIVLIFFSTLGKAELLNTMEISMPMNEYFAKSVGKFVGDFGHPFISVLALHEQNLESSRSLAYSFAFFERIGWFFGFPKESISHHNTFLLTNIFESNIPPGIIAWALYQGGIFYLGVVGFLFGILTKYFDLLIVHIRRGKSYLTLSLITGLLLDSPRWVFGGDLGIYFFSIGPFIFTLILFITFGRIKVAIKPMQDLC